MESSGFTADEHRRIDDGRPSAEEMLERVRRVAGAGAAGRLRIYLGMAPGVGKTYAMLQEGHRRKERGTDVVIGFVETYGRPQTEAALGNLEIVPRMQISYKGVFLEEMDTEAVIRRRPAIALVDELAHTNAPGSKHEKRWQDVEELLQNGITVIATLNIQHLDSAADMVESITGAKVRERLPDGIVDRADEVELVDMSPHALRQRIHHGNVYPAARAEQALRGFFREGNLAALRELALRKVSATVEHDLEEYMHQHKVETIWPASERVLVAVGSGREVGRLLRRGWRIANRMQSELIAVFIETPGWASSTPEEKRRTEESLRLAEDLGARVIRRAGSNVATTLAEVAREENVASVVTGHTRHKGLDRFFSRSVAARLLDLLPEVDITVVAERPNQS